MFVTITVTDSTFGVSRWANFGHERRWCLALVVRAEMNDASIFLLIDRKHDDLANPHSDLVWLARDPLREDSDGWLDVALIS